MNYVYPEPWCINSAVLLCNVHSSCTFHLRQRVKCGHNVWLHHPLSNTFISITSPWSFQFLLTCMPSCPEIPTPTSATWIILTSLAPSPRMNEKNRDKKRVRKRGKWVINSVSLCTMSACINANIASAAKCSAGKNKQHKLSAKEPRNKLRFLKLTGMTQCIRQGDITLHQCHRLHTWKMLTTKSKSHRNPKRGQSSYILHSIHQFKFKSELQISIGMFK